MADLNSASTHSPEYSKVQMPWGLHLLLDTSKDASDDLAVDIIAVHGLGANPDHAWVYHQETTQGTKADVKWLTDLLPHTLRDNKPSIHARIFCFNYQSAWLGPKLTKNRLENIAGRLLDDLHHMRNKTAQDGIMSDRPLIFIGHSFGGLVVEQAVVKANSSSNMYRYLVELIGGVILLRTPHQGSKTQKWGSILAHLANFIELGETTLMADVDEKSMKIFDLVFEFMRVMIRLGLVWNNAAMSFCENLPTNYLRRVVRISFEKQTSSMVVEEASAVLPGLHYVVLDSDHLKLNKFANAEDGNYVSVSSNLSRIAAKAPQLIRDRRKETASHQEKHFLVSREPVKDFIGRGRELHKILSHFSTRRGAQPRYLILHALGGQGKSQIALEYCRLSRETYRGIFWINANSEELVTQSYEEIEAALTGVSSITREEAEAKIRFVKDSLERWSERWLLVFDNYDEPEKFLNIKRFIPSGGPGDVLFTSRRADLDRLGTLLEIPPMTTEDGVRLLLRGYDEHNIQQHTWEGSRIVTRLGGLALAIDQAAAYIKYKRIPLERLAEFLTTYEAQRQKILEYTPKKFWEYGTMQFHEEAEQKKGISAFTTWEMSFQQLELQDASTKDEVAHFLTLSSFFDPAKIGESLFRHHWESNGSQSQWMYIFSTTEDVKSDDNLSPDGGSAGHRDSDDLTSRHHSSFQSETAILAPQSRGTWDSERFWDVIAQSYELSLLQNITSDVREGASFSLHPLIRDWLQLREKVEGRRKYSKEGVDIVLSSIKEHETRIATPEQNLVLMAHMDASLANDAQFSKSQNSLGRDVANCDTARAFAHFYRGQGRYLASERLTCLIMETQRRDLGEEHPETLVSMNDMAQVLSDLGEYAEAEKMNRQTLKLRERILGKEHLNTLTSMSNLAKALEQQNEYDEAEEINQQVLEAREKVLGEMHLDTLISVTIRGYLLRHRGNYIEAEKMHRRALEEREKQLGQEHSDTLESLNNLAYVMSCQRKYGPAGEIYQRVLETRKKVLGPEHPRTLGSINNLAYVLARGGKYAQAEDMYRYVLTARTRVLGSQHPKTMKSENNLFWVLLYQGKDKEADDMNRTVTEELTS